METGTQLKLCQKPKIPFEEQTNVGDAVLDHDEAFDAESEREALPFFCIDTGIFKDVRVNHSTSADFQPVTLFRFRFSCPSYIHLETGFDKWKVSRAKAEVDIRGDEFLNCGNHDRFHIREVHVFSNHESLKLVEHGGMRRIRVATIDLPRTDHPERRFMRAHVVDLNRGGVCSE